jgi:hypothetical protein
MGGLMLPTTEMKGGMIVVRFPDDDVILYFSYGNLIGFRNKENVYIRKESVDIDDTTNRHLNKIKRQYVDSPFTLHECVDFGLTLKIKETSCYTE